MSGEQNEQREADVAGDYFEGLEEGIKIGRREAVEAAVAAAQRPAGNHILDFHARQAIIVNRVRNCLTGDS